MMDCAQTWALVLAAGEGSRLRSLTTSTSGASVPKQFCSLHAGPSLLHEALGRAADVAAARTTCVIVAEEHRHWWEPLLIQLPGENVLAQPRNRGTAHGMLLPLLHILERDPDARLFVFPADHHVRREQVLAAALRQAAQRLQGGGRDTLLLGLQPEESDPELGYIVPGAGVGSGVRPVLQFVEKPPVSMAHELITHGALWNSFILAAPAVALLELFRRRVPETVRQMQAAVRALRRSGATQALAELYRELPSLDFCRDILTGQEPSLSVLPVPQCGWSDLGTPGRVADALRRMPAGEPLRPAPRMGRGYLSLSAQYESYRSRTAFSPVSRSSSSMVVSS